MKLYVVTAHYVNNFEYYYATFSRGVYSTLEKAKERVRECYEQDLEEMKRFAQGPNEHMLDIDYDKEDGSYCIEILSGFAHYVECTITKEILDD